MTKRITKTTLKHWAELQELADARNCVKCEDWTSGTNGYTTNRALPTFVYRIERQVSTDAPDRCKKSAEAFFEQYPRRKKVIVIDRDSIEEWLSANGQEAG